MARVRIRLAVVVALLTVAVLTGCGDDSAEKSRPALSADQADALVQRLQAGGNVLVLRHAATDSAADMTGDLSDCSRQRNLSAEGRRQARMIGKALKRLDVPIDYALASAFCRTRDTASLITSRVFTSRALLPPEVFAELPEGSYSSGYSLARQVTGWFKPPEKSNLMLVSHESTIAKAIRVRLLEGETAVVAPAAGRPGYRVVARLLPVEWRRIAER